MPNQNLTEIICVIDRSGSMCSIRDDAQGGFNQFIKDQKREPGLAKITLVQFDDEYEVVWDSVPLVEAPYYTLMPRATTALLDAIGKTISMVGERYANMNEDDRPGKVVFMILTDGHENASREYSKARINEMITHQKEKYSWNFLFLAANQDAIAEAGSLGIPQTYSMNFAATGQGVQSAYHVVSQGMKQYRYTGRVQSLNLPDDAPLTSSVTGADSGDEASS